jgi:hypothetical protein
VLVFEVMYSLVSKEPGKIEGSQCLGLLGRDNNVACWHDVDYFSKHTVFPIIISAFGE